MSARKPRMPAEVRVGPFVYALTCDTLSHILVEHGNGSEKLLGHTNHTGLAITLNPDMADLQTRSTALHEVLHAVITTAGMEITTADEERLVRVLEAPLFQLIRDNPELIAWLSD